MKGSLIVISWNGSETTHFTAQSLFEGERRGKLVAESSSEKQRIYSPYSPNPRSYTYDLKPTQ